jgi:hypothetical protein
LLPTITLASSQKDELVCFSWFVFCAHVVQGGEAAEDGWIWTGMRFVAVGLAMATLVCVGALDSRLTRLLDKGKYDPAFINELEGIKPVRIISHLFSLSC